MLHEIVIIGGGFGGLKIAKKLSSFNNWEKKKIHITVIDKNRYHTFQPNLYEVASSFMIENFEGEKERFLNLKSSASVSFEEIFLENLNISFLEDEFTDIDFKENQVYLKSGNKKDYDFLVIAVGSKTNYFNISGLYENSFPLKNINEALQLRNEIDEIFINTPKNQNINIVIGGGGFTGCELAGEIAGYIKKLSKIHSRPENTVFCTIVDATTSLIFGTSFWTQKKALKRLESLGVKFILGSPIKEVVNKKIVLKNELIVPFDILIWTGGVKSSCEKVDDFLRIIDHKNVFGVGDTIFCLNKKSNTPFPMTASIALRQASCVAENIKNIILKKDLISRNLNSPGFIIPLGGKYAILEKGKIKIAGFLPWILKQIISLQYWISILGFIKGFKIWKNGVKIFLKND